MYNLRHTKKHSKYHHYLENNQRRSIIARPKQKLHASGLVEHKATIGKTLDGKRIQKSFYGSSKLEAKRKAEEYILQQKVSDVTGEINIQKEYTFSEWAEKWLEIYKKPHVSENSYGFTYENTVKTHLLPYFKQAKLTSIPAMDIQNFFATKTMMLETMLSKMSFCLHGIFETAIENDLCYKNPARKISYTSAATKYEKRIYTPEHLEQVKIASYISMPEVVVILETGLRRGELL